ncbi:MAG: hypothetical protein CM15mV33_350 [uncultured marine virus]|nr:MAG: hypothetical protein CM15mV33_350 [uncultured marine virus]
MATEYERIDKLMKALAGLISPTLNVKIPIFRHRITEKMKSDRVDSIESDFLQKDD